jgi:TP901 family phage tail tape measure protein
MNREITLMMRLQADASRLVNQFISGERGIKKFVSTAKSEFKSFKSELDFIDRRLAGLGVTIGATATVWQSAKLDKNLTQIGQTAGASKDDVKLLRQELFQMAEETGQEVDELKDGFNNAVQAGLEFSEAKNVIDATNKAMAVTGATADKLTGSLTVAGTAFDFDLTKPGQALNILDRMLVAGRKGNAELENLSDIFGRIGPNASSAGMGFDQTLAFIEGLSQIERQPERLATLADSTLRLFTNLQYTKEAQKATKVKFFDPDGSRRDAFAVIDDIKKQYDKLTTDKDKALYIQKAFGKADLDTIKGMRILLSGDMMTTIKGFAEEIKSAGGSIERDLPAAISNSVDQVGRLKTTLREAADGFAQPINDAITKSIKYTLDGKEKGGMGWDGTDVMLAGGGAAVTAILAKRLGGKAIKKFAGLGADVATGKALESAAGVMPVFVVNMPSGLGGGMVPDVPGKSSLDKIKSLGKSAAPLGMMKNIGLAAAPLAAMWGVTEWAGNTKQDVSRAEGMLDFTKGVNKIFSYDPDAKQKAWREKQDRELRGEIKVTLHDDRAPTAVVKTNQSNVRLNVANGQHMRSD